MAVFIRSHALRHVERISGHSPPTETASHTREALKELIDGLDSVSSSFTSSGTMDHGSLSGLGDDDHPQYFLLAGRGGGQVGYGGNASGDALTLQGSTGDASAKVLFGTSSGAGRLGTTSGFRVLDASANFLGEWGTDGTSGVLYVGDNSTASTKSYLKLAGRNDTNGPYIYSGEKTSGAQLTFCTSGAYVAVSPSFHVAYGGRTDQTIFSDSVTGAACYFGGGSGVASSYAVIGASTGGNAAQKATRLGFISDGVSVGDTTAALIHPPGALLDIRRTTDAVALIVEEAAAATSNIQQWKQTGTGTLSFIDSAGTFNGPIAPTGLVNFDHIVVQPSTDIVPIAIKATSGGQTAHLLDFYDDGGNITTYFTRQGCIVAQTSGSSDGVGVNIWRGTGSIDTFRVSNTGGSATLFSMNYDASIFTWTNFLSMTAAINTWSLKDASNRVLLQTKSGASGANWSDGASTGLLQLHAATPDGQRTVLMNSAGTFHRLGISADQVVIDNNSASVITAPTGMVDLFNSQDPTVSVLRLVPHASQSADIARVRNGTDTGNLIAVGSGGAITATPSSGTALSLVAPSGTGTAFDTQINDASYPTAGGNIWNMNVTADNASTITGAVRGLNISGSVGGLAGGGAVVLNASFTANGVSGTNALAGLNFTGTAGSGNWSTVTGSLVIARHGTTGTITTLTGIQAQVTSAGSGLGNITTIHGYNALVAPSGGGTYTDVYGYRLQSLNPGSSTTFTTAYGLSIPAFAGSGSIGTVYGIKIGNQTKGGTANWAIYSEGGQSSHVGNLYLGANTAPTARLHAAAQTASASTAPIKKTSGTLMTAPEAGAEEYDGSYFYLTIDAASRSAIATDANVCVDDGTGDILTYEGELLLAA